MSTVERKCKNCQAVFSARSADVKRGWARYCSKSCKASEQTRRTGYAGPTGQEGRLVFPSHADCDVQPQEEVMSTEWKLVPVEPTDKMLSAVWTLHQSRPWPEAGRAAYAAMLAASPQPAAQPEQPEPGVLTEIHDYGAMDWGYCIAGISMADGDKRLMAMLVHALGSDHPAIDDMTALLFRAAGSTTRKLSDEQVARIMEVVDKLVLAALNHDSGAADAARAEFERLLRGEA